MSPTATLGVGPWEAASLVSALRSAATRPLTAATTRAPTGGAASVVGGLKRSLLGSILWER